MNDEFLRSYHKSPRREFSESLYRTITQKENHEMLSRTVPTFKRLAFGLAVLCLAFSMALAFSPTARAKFLDMVREIGNMSFTETLDYPGGSGPETTFPEKKMSLAEAASAFPLPIRLPSYLPEGFEADLDQVSVMVSDQYSLAYLMVSFINTDDPGKITLWIVDEEGEDGMKMSIAPGSVEELSINGEPAALVRGAWNYNTREWGDPGLMQLLWDKDGASYVLSAAETATSIEELIRIAESIP